jgi:hypothetical protein
MEDRSFSLLRFVYEDSRHDDLPPLNVTPPELRFSSKYAERVAAKHPVTLDKRFIHPRPEEKEE